LKTTAVIFRCSSI